jgi:endonuclease/exonuclease/phosphatase family metal-dependent hydrolase
VHQLYDPSIKYVVPIRVTSSTECFTLLAVWAMNDRLAPEKRYIAQVWLAATRYASLLDGSVLIMGDFNWNVIWDDSPGLCANFAQAADLFSHKGIGSLYHSSAAEDFGQETAPTLYLYRQVSRPYHVDYIFASRDFADRLLSLKVGDYSDWSAYSDHMPIVASFRD